MVSSKIKPPKPKLLPKSRSEPERFKKYRTKRSGDTEWHAFNLARNYVNKVNRKDNCTRQNSVRGPSDEMMEKHELYKQNGRWYSSVVDRYCMTHASDRKKCRKN